jgi:hypothetical protein
MKKLGIICFFILIAVVFVISACDLLYPPSFYNSLVNGGGGKSAGGWKTVVSQSTGSIMSIRLVAGNNDQTVVYTESGSSGSALWVKKFSGNTVKFASSLNAMNFSLTVNESGVPYLEILAPDGINITNFAFTGSSLSVAAADAYALAPTAIAFAVNGTTPVDAYFYNSAGYYVNVKESLGGSSWVYDYPVYFDPSLSINQLNMAYDSTAGYFMAYILTNALLIRNSGGIVTNLAVANVVTIDSALSYSMAVRNGYAYTGCEQSSMDSSTYSSTFSILMNRYGKNGLTSLGKLPLGNYYINGYSIAAGNNGKIYAVVALSLSTNFNIQFVKVFQYTGSSWSLIGGNTESGFSSSFVSNAQPNSYIDHVTFNSPSIDISPGGMLQIAYLKTEVDNSYSSHNSLVIKTQ